eukprot:1194322-Prorocentrum_minimum.AAC.2
MVQFTNQTSLHWAAADGHLSIVKLLIESGADIDATHVAGYTALHEASQRGHYDVVKASTRPESHRSCRPIRRPRASVTADPTVVSCCSSGIRESVLGAVSR